jgi:hypothetical protein
LQPPSFSYQMYPSQGQPAALGHGLGASSHSSHESLGHHGMATSQGDPQYSAQQWQQLQGLMKVVDSHPLHSQSMSTQAPPSLEELMQQVVHSHQIQSQSMSTQAPPSLEGLMQRVVDSHRMQSQSMSTQAPPSQGLMQQVVGSHQMQSPSMPTQAPPSLEGLMQLVADSHRMQSQFMSTEAPPPQPYLVPQSQNIGVTYDQQPPEAGPSSATQTATEDKPPPKHKCHICSKFFHRPGARNIHVFSHTGERPWPCPFEGCLRSGEGGFSVKSNMTRHKKTCKARRVD